MFYSFKLFIFIQIYIPSAMVYILSNLENSENRYKEVTSPMSGYQSQSKEARITMKKQY